MDGTSGPICPGSSSDSGCRRRDRARSRASMARTATGGRRKSRRKSLVGPMPAACRELVFANVAGGLLRGHERDRERLRPDAGRPLAHLGGPRPTDTLIFPCSTASISSAWRKRALRRRKIRPVRTHSASPPFCLDPRICGLIRWTMSRHVGELGGDHRSLRFIEVSAAEILRKHEAQGLPPRFRRSEARSPRLRTPASDCDDQNHVS